MKKIITVLGIITLSSCASQSKMAEREPNQSKLKPVLTCLLDLNQSRGDKDHEELKIPLEVKGVKKSDIIGEYYSKVLNGRFEISAVASRSGFDENDIYYSVQLTDELNGFTTFQPGETYYTERHANTGINFHTTIFYKNSQKPVRVENRDVKLRSVQDTSIVM